MADQESVWYRIGYGLEQTRRAVPRAPRLRSLAERRQDKVAPPRPGRPVAARPSAPADPSAPEEAPHAAVADAEDAGEGYDALLAALAAALASRALGLVPARRRPGVGGLLRAGAAGAGAAVLRELLRPLVSGRGEGRPLPDALSDAAVAGTARGLLYGALIEPRLPGPTLVRGALFGCAEYLASPWGGLTRLAGRSAPHRKVPVLSGLFEDLGPGEDTLADHMVFALALALLYEAGGKETRAEDA